MWESTPTHSWVNILQAVLASFLIEELFLDVTSSDNPLILGLHRRLNTLLPKGKFGK